MDQARYDLYVSGNSKSNIYPDSVVVSFLTKSKYKN